VALAQAESTVPFMLTAECVTGSRIVASRSPIPHPSQFRSAEQR
jgi:hypothetical protein